MEKYTLLFVLLTFIGEYCGQVVISNVRGPSVIRNIHNVNENGTSVVNIVDDDDGHGTSVIATGSNRPVVIKDVSSTVIDGSSGLNGNSYIHSHTSTSSTGNHSGVTSVVSTTRTENTDQHKKRGNGAPGLFKSYFWHLLFVYSITYLIY